MHYAQTSYEAAMKAANVILSVCPPVTAADPQAFTAALVQLLCCYPPAVVKAAADPVHGICGKLELLSIAGVKKVMDAWAVEHWERAKRERGHPPRLEAPENPEMKARVSALFADLTRDLKAGKVLPKNEQMIAERKREQLSHQIDRGFSPSTAAE